jgi:predicted deacetylase
MLEDNTTILDRPSASVKCLAQQGVERVVEVTPASGVASDGSRNPSFQLLLLWKVGVVAQAAVATSVIWVSSSGWGAQWWCRGRLQREHRGAAAHRLYFLLKRERRALLLQLLSSTLLLLVQAVVQPLQMAILTNHRTAKRTLRETRRQERNDWLPCSVSKTSHLQKTP